MGVNKFTDYSPEEFGKLLGFVPGTEDDNQN